ncbi:glycoside hydrolase family 65 protein [Streptacidiphilus sp. EB129]|uniref:glycoside hydrolase family 65 protein n=1 Tax=Streptacidiphilus sp. EB129 TaxID=3156262 RepID=UPI00351220A3
MTVVTEGEPNSGAAAHRRSRAADSEPWDDPWMLSYKGFDPTQEGLREVLCAVGNGYLVTRAAAPESVADGTHYPGTYLAGCYDRTTSTVQGRAVENEDLVNMPNWLPLSFRIGAMGGWFGAADAALPGDRPFEILDQRLELDLRRGVLTRRALVVDGAGRRTRLVQRRIAHMAQPHLVALQTLLVPENWSGRLDIRSGIDGTVRNTGVARYRELTSHHLDPVDHGAEGELSWLQVATAGSPLTVAMAARTGVHLDGKPVPVARCDELSDALVAQILTVDAAAGRPLVVEKTVAVYTSRDPAVDGPLRAARRLAGRADSFEVLLRAHALRWEELWRRCRTEVDAARTGPVHLYLFHLLQTVSEHSADLDVGVPARGLHGEGYRGHVFWDELFVLQVLNLRLPELSRSVLRYRHRRLDEARSAARGAGFRGAMYPWQSAADGSEETQRVHLNPVSGRWLPDHSHLQRHVGSAIAYNVWQYYQATGDLEFLESAGAEMLLEIARFWADIAVFDADLGRFRIRGVVGPDEYHEAYPWAAGPGLDDNAYTNVLASWVLARALEALRILPGYRSDELAERMGLGGEELDRWRTVSRALHVPFHEGVITQFDGYERLAELDWDGYRRRYPDIRRLDRILEAEGDSVNRYKVSKQADVLMLYYLFSPREVHDLLHRLGYRAGDELFRATADYYLSRTAHGSTLSAVVHAWVLARSDRRASWRFFRDALDGDVHDIQGGTTAEGIHLGAMAGTIDLLQRCYTGLELREDVLWLAPRLPGPLRRLELELRYRGSWGVCVTVDRKDVTVRVADGRADPLTIGFRGSLVRVGPGEIRTLTL